MSFVLRPGVGGVDLVVTGEWTARGASPLGYGMAIRRLGGHTGCLNTHIAVRGDQQMTGPHVADQRHTPWPRSSTCPSLAPTGPNHWGRPDQILRGRGY